uniref:Uncharacterized protein n=1 Tax=Meloidogyne enterolobii TaxID=390850 RepID=A0A6V7WQY0_MELEN|nr:unnamed protein product [Meloidogyne enterolobii]
MEIKTSKIGGIKTAEDKTENNLINLIYEKFEEKIKENNNKIFLNEVNNEEINGKYINGFDENKFLKDEMNEDLIFIANVINHLDKKVISKNIQRSADLLFALYQSYYLINFASTISQIENILDCIEQAHVPPTNLLNYFSIKELKQIFWKILGINKCTDNIEEKRIVMTKIIFSDSYSGILDILSVRKEEKAKNILNVLTEANEVLTRASNILKKTQNFQNWD